MSIPTLKTLGFGEPPLWFAVEWGHERVVKLLLNRKDIDPNATDNNHGQTSLSPAAENEHEGIARFLLARGDISPNTRGIGNSRTPLA